MNAFTSTKLASVVIILVAATKVASAAPLTGNGQHLPIPSNNPGNPPREPATTTPVSGGFQGSWTAPALPAWHGTFDATGPNPAATNSGITRYTFNNLDNSTGGPLPTGTIFGFSDVDSGSGTEMFTLQAWDAAVVLLDEWLDEPFAVGGTTAVVSSSMPGWEWNATTKAYTIDGATVASSPNPNLAVYLRSNQDIHFMEVRKSGTNHFLRLNAPVVPEPGTLALLLSGVAGMAFCRRRVRTAVSGLLVGLTLVGGVGGSAQADIFRYRLGVADSYQAPVELATPSVDMQLLYSNFGPPFRQYDQGGDNRHFIETIDNLPVCIDDAVLFTGVRPTGPVDIANFARGTTDIFRFLFTSNTFSGTQAGPHWTSRIGDPNADASLLPQNWGTDNYPQGVGFVLGLANLPLGTNNTNGSTANLIPAMEQFGHLNFEVSDDTAIDYIQMNVFTPLTGDINGDGTVDNGDLSLAIALDGQQPPNGVGDTNGDDIINNIDQSNILGNFGASCIIPEPSSLVLLSLCSVMLVARRRNSNRRVLHVERAA